MIFLSPFVPMASSVDGIMQQLPALPEGRRTAEGLTLNPCLQLLLSLLAVAY